MLNKDMKATWTNKLLGFQWRFLSIICAFWGQHQIHELELEKILKSSLLEANLNPFTVVKHAGICRHRNVKLHDLCSCDVSKTLRAERASRTEISKAVKAAVWTAVLIIRVSLVYEYNLPEPQISIAIFFLMGYVSCCKGRLQKLIIARLVYKFLEGLLAFIPVTWCTWIQSAYAFCFF
jgi:hypothetical protein